MNNTPLGIVGNGFMATHIMHYFDMEKTPYINWSRSSDSISPAKKLINCNPILVLIKDGCIDRFIEENPELQSKELIHFSGALKSEKAIGIHPLMTFSSDLYSYDQYIGIPFVGERGNPTLKELLPTLKNPYYQIDGDKKGLYHALCVISGNFTSILWQKTVKGFEDQLNLPGEVLAPYLERVMKNIKDNPFNSLTGPIKRGDITTIKKNKIALSSPLWAKIYSLFNKAYKKELK